MYFLQLVYNLPPHTNTKKENITLQDVEELHPPPGVCEMAEKC